MAVKKSEIYSSLWSSCDELRGGMDASQYKDYVLVLLFMKYVSDKYAGRPNALIEVPEGGGFADMVALKGDKEIGEKINIIIARLAEANDLKGVIDVADFNDPDKLGTGKDMVDRLSNLVAIFNRPELDFKKNRAEGDDILGDAYEYLMRHFATESGKSKGQFYTPAEVSRIMAKVIGIGSAKSSDQTIYDLACGSGSLLLKAHDEAPYDLTIYGQEMDNATRALAKMNMILHDCPTAEIWRGNTLSSPYFKNPDGSLKTFDFVVANPPFSNKAWMSGFDPANDEYKRFTNGVPPKKNGDYAYLQHHLASLKSTGKGAIILPHGVLFRGNVEATIRRNIVRRGYIKGIIGLPPNLFYGTGIPACIIVVDKEHAAARTGVFMIDASKGFVKEGNKNRLRAQDIHKIVDVFTRQIEIDKFSRMVLRAEIEGRDYNLNIPRYIDSAKPEDFQDIEAHLKGGIPERDIDALVRYWEVMPSLRAELFAPDRTGYSRPKVEATNVKATIHGHPQFQEYAEQVNAVFEGWKASNIEKLRAFDKDGHPKVLIHEISEDLLGRLAAAPLIDKYDVYQHLMTYWSEVMQDDAYQIAFDGWQVTEDLIPPPLIIRRYLADEAAKIEVLEAEREAAEREKEEMDEEHGGEDGLLAEAKTDKGNLTKASVSARMKEIKHAADKSLTAKEKQIDKFLKSGAPIPNDLRTDLIENDGADFLEFIQIKEALALIEREAALKKQVKEATKKLEAKVVEKYKTLTEAEVKVLVVEYKWLSSLEGDVRSELDRVSQTLTGRIKLLTERYAAPLPKLVAHVEALSVKIDAHLKRMGFAWN